LERNVLSLWMVTYFLASGLNMSHFLSTLDSGGFRHRVIELIVRVVLIMYTQPLLDINDAFMF
jgi:hypothetical protein